MKISERKNKVEIATAPDMYVAGLRNDDKNKVEIAAARWTRVFNASQWLLI